MSNQPDPAALNRAAQERLELLGELEELRTCVAAAADGNTRLAEIYQAGRVLGVRRAEGDWVAPFQSDKVGAHCRIRLNYIAQSLLVLRRLWVHPVCAERFSLLSFSSNHQEILHHNAQGSEIPCSLFAKRYGTPLFHRVLQFGEVVGLEVCNDTGSEVDFRAVALGYQVKRPD